MSGPIPDIFANMVSLAHLYLFEAGLEGGIPSCFGNMSNLVDIYLNKNNLSGELSELMMNLSGPIEDNLQSLDLSWNSISGSFPNMSRFSSLTWLVLNTNQLNGSIQEELGIGSNFFGGIITEVSMSKLSQLQVLDLSSNPSLIVKFSPHWVPPFQLQSLRLKHCRSGPDFPLWLKTQKQLIAFLLWFAGIARNLLYLNTSNNQIIGVFPYSALRHSLGTVLLDLSRNNIFCSIDFLCHIKHLLLLDLSDNNLSGHIPNYFTQIERLKYLNLVNNNFSGKIPHSFGSLSALSLLHLRNNSFLGELPTSMAYCTNLVMIDIGENRLTGKVLAWIGEGWPQLKVLILRFSEFYGCIPSNLCGLAKIQVLDLSSNKISRVIPNCLCGLPLNKSCPEDEPRPDSNSSNSALSKEDAKDDGFISEGFYIALGLGLIVGFWGIVGTILLNKAMQYAFVEVMNTVEDFVYVRVEITKARLLRRFKNG
ncbi:Leucine-rich repeat (LRR) protein associated with apoptosis in muscle tissue [Handroanthus impetiginosus]|uniref:Leucine-rich repeat (LRR) protein associated with apoptosis in muscle tissue n=1 Tax=Handroanthus impetiginosus TaxID=429701 RepID=A0A2G9HHW2_9LAMI|nr:Leucine-rich repeat (LRR) protein associated with apoptosis in muscle tissue [Handroanthus impetiginosus]